MVTTRWMKLWRRFRHFCFLCTETVKPLTCNADDPNRPRCEWILQRRGGSASERRRVRQNYSLAAARTKINSVALTEVHAEVAGGGAQIVAITPERQAFTALHVAEARAPYRILSDINNGYALSLNLAIWVGEEMMREMSAFGRDLEDYQGNPSWFLPIPATFVVKRDGTIAARFVDPDYRRRMDLSALLDAAARAN